jgi:hypothetical protein
MSHKGKHRYLHMGNKGGEACGMACEAESKPRGTADLFRHIPSGLVKSVGKKWSRHKNLQRNNTASTLVHFLPTLSAHICALQRNKRLYYNLNMKHH